MSQMSESTTPTTTPASTPTYRHSLEDARPDIRHALRHQFLVDVDPVVVARRERASIAGGLGEADQQQRERRDPDHREVRLDQVEAGQLRRRKPTRNSADYGDTVRGEIEDGRGEETTDDEHEGTRNRRSEESQPEDHGQGCEPHQ